MKEVFQINYYPGYKNEGDMEYVKVPFGSINMFGVVGSGKSVLLENLIAQLLINYTEKDLILRMFDGKGYNIVSTSTNSMHSKESRLKINTCDMACNKHDCSVDEFIDGIVNEINTRVKFFRENYYRNYDEYIEYRNNDADKLLPIIYIIDDADPYDILDVVENLEYAQWMGDIVGIYTVFSNNPQSMYMKMKKPAYTIVTCFEDKCAKELFGALYTPDMEFDRYGTCYVLAKNSVSLMKLHVPFYNIAKVKDIVDSITVPNGVVLKDWQREELRKFYLT